ncbi:preprotein translocase, SecG subunit (plasmid) [Pseudarthrobacter chlorophenolicus A6]|uniref:Protein-export membrane protein SecG n=1 Tax=Pseudarthrobacter chlorophenolicus (strain ATCC 700700 / DSM 12829 / CIP 107037 / JCM 12360 / KCTC 9906 / NCIMB 13794 / A6) TaxID=452863 RepID=B8HHK7_PSECP|nr:preprotein translocase subunit SecG [Pseudarthrobacter chlorophenolicus]ACL41904.1 preprotein translocase, SecG subunit [Pseudarthrobacter chlorophenolicus A6]SDQ18428.1 preprotein translocase subunit SecG [Pseudarthrobacter chlorophenolicus]
MNILIIALQVLVVASSVIMGAFILLHKASGGGVSDMFGGGMTNSLNSTGVAEKNLTRFTIVTATLWAAAIMALAVLTRFTGL